MKKTIVKTLIIGTMALSLLISGAAAISTANSGVAVCHDGPLDEVFRK